MSLRITVLTDNIAESPFVREYGLSLLISVKGISILFDTGQGEAFGINCGILGIDPSQAEKVVLSHGHYDHGGNLATALKESNATLFLHPETLTKRYSFHPDHPAKSIGLTNKNAQAVLDHNHSKVKWIYGVTKVIDGVFVTGSIPRINSYEDTGGPFYLTPDRTTPDAIIDDMALWIETPKGLVVICGCCHSGLVNTLSYIRKITDSPVHTVMGGFHLLHSNEMRLEKTITYLNGNPPQQIIPLHCTGEDAVSFLKKRCSSRVIAGGAGFCIEV